MRRIFVCKLHHLSTPLKTVTFPLIDVQQGFVYRTARNQFVGFANVCLHRGLELDWDGDGDFFEGQSFLRCKAHGAKFDAVSGDCVYGPRSCLGKSLHKLNIDVDGEDVFVLSDLTSILDFRKDFR